MIKTISDFNVKGKRVLVRCDFNVPLNKGMIEDDFRIQQTIPTIEYLVEKRAKVVLMSHLGSPKGERVEELRLTPIAKKLSELLGCEVKKTNNCVGKETDDMISGLKEGEVLLLENLRFHKGEEENDLSFAKELASLADIYINDAFGVSHRSHASVVRIAELIPSGAGFLLKKEIDVLSKVIKDPIRPLVAIIGGAKIESKIKIIKEFSKTADHLLLGGMIGNTVLKVNGEWDNGPEPSSEVIEEVKKFDFTSTKVHLPVDAIASFNNSGEDIRKSALAEIQKEELLLDIGPGTINIFSQIIKEAGMIVWAGPLGFFERPAFENGTKKIAEEIARSKAFKIVGGGDTVFAVSKFGLAEKFDHISTGGGAMLDFLGGENLPGLKIL